MMKLYNKLRKKERIEWKDGMDGRMMNCVLSK